MCSMWKRMCVFYYFKPHKHIAIHKIMFFLYDPFKPHEAFENVPKPCLELSTDIFFFGSGFLHYL